MMLTPTTISARTTTALSLCLALGTGLWHSPPAQADALASKLQVTVVPGWRSADGSHMAALHLKLAPGWKTYWRAPGDAGIPPLLHSTQTQNPATITPIWPTPEMFSQNGMRSVGYDAELVLPLHITASGTAQPSTVSGKMQIGICNDICVPVSFDFTLDLPTAGTPQQQQAIRSALADQPLSAREAGVQGVTCALSPVKDGLGLSVTIDMPAQGSTETVLIEAADPAIWVAETHSSRDGNRLTATTELVHTSGQAFALDRSGLRFTVLGSQQAVDIRGCSAS